jgi:hypothetical protein
MGTIFRKYISKVPKPLFIGLICGIVGVLPDIDHIVAYETGMDYTFVRPWHTSILVGSSIVLGTCYACLGGLLIKLVLRNK